MKVETGSLAVNEITKKMCIIEEVKVEKQKQTLITKKNQKTKALYVIQVIQQKWIL